MTTTTTAAKKALEFNLSILHYFLDGATPERAKRMVEDAILHTAYSLHRWKEIATKTDKDDPGLFHVWEAAICEVHKDPDAQINTALNFLDTLVNHKSFPIEIGDGPGSGLRLSIEKERDAAITVFFHFIITLILNSGTPSRQAQWLRLLKLAEKPYSSYIGANPFGKALDIALKGAKVKAVEPLILWMEERRNPFWDSFGGMKPSFDSIVIRHLWRSICSDDGGVVHYFIYYVKILQWVIGCEIPLKCNAAQGAVSLEEVQSACADANEGIVKFAKRVHNLQLRFGERTSGLLILSRVEYDLSRMTLQRVVFVFNERHSSFRKGDYKNAKFVEDALSFKTKEVKSLCESTELNLPEVCIDGI